MQRRIYAPTLRRALQPQCVHHRIPSLTRHFADSNQAHPLHGYYADLLDPPLRKTTPATRTAPITPPSDDLPQTDEEEKLAKARVVFGSRLAGPAERQEKVDAASEMVAGVLVPPKPAEPDNCCMSGCVNCVWDLYRDELEEWAAKSAEARARIQDGQGMSAGEAVKAGQSVGPEGLPSNVAASMDDDGGGSETNWAGEESFGKGAGNVDLFENVPVGIREFMKTEKKLKAKQGREASGG